MKGLVRRADALTRHLRARLNGGIVPFSPGRFVAARDRAAFSARTFYEVDQLQATMSLASVQPQAVLEIGSGYGRLSPWLSRRAGGYHGIEPNDKARGRARSLYPDLEFHDATAQDLPFEPDSFDFVLAWTVFQHIPESSFGEALAEVDRVTMPTATVLLCEKTGGERTRVVHPRSVETYDEHLTGFQLEAVEQRATEPERPTHESVMLFRGKP